MNALSLWSAFRNPRERRDRVSPRPGRRVRRTGQGQSPRLDRLEDRLLLAAGDLDTTFGSAGQVVLASATVQGSISGLVVQPDGKIVASVNQSNFANPSLVAVRFNGNGTLDTTFGTNGVASTKIGTNPVAAMAIALQSDGKIVEAGLFNSAGTNSFALVRFNSNGTLDTTFGTNGTVTTPAAGSGFAQSVAIQPNGMIVAAGSSILSGNLDYDVARYNTNGTLDTTFGNNGTVDYKLPTGQAGTLHAVAIQNDGKIVLAGDAGGNFALVRLNATGTTDTNFGNGGIAGGGTTNFAEFGRSVVIQPNGKIVQVGDALALADFQVERWLANGTPDPSFGTGGIVRVAPGTMNLGAAAAIQTDGKIVVVGTSGPSLSTSSLATLRFNVNGTPDANYGTNGVSTTTFPGGGNRGVAVALQPADGNIVAGGSTASSTQVAAARFLSGLAAPDPFTVTNTLDSGPGSLRQAILNSNSSAGGNTIKFAIADTGPFTIIPISALPAISMPVTIDATTEPGYSGTPLIELDGVNAGSNTAGLAVFTNNTTVKGFAINRFGSHGVEVFGNNDVVAACYIGTDVTGTTALANGGVGVLIDGAGDTVGGSTAGLGNVLSGNGSQGVQFIGSATTSGVAEGNKIGTNAAGTAAIPNKGDGVVVDVQASNVLIGTNGDGINDPLERNIISGNTFWGVSIDGAGTNNNVVAGNYIGTDVTGTLPLGNSQVGVGITGGAQSTIIGTNGDGKGDAAERNVIANNAFQGVYIGGAGTNNNVVAGNLIGTDVTGTKPMGNGNNGILINAGAQSNRIGVKAGDAGAAAEPNIISENTFWGVSIDGAGTNNNVVAGNDIGTDVTGTLPLGNNQVGVGITGGAQSNIVGTNGDGIGDAAERNVIANNAFQGVYIGDAGTNNNVVAGNFIGTDVTGTKAMGNGNNGVLINAGPQSNRVGMKTGDPGMAAESNVIAFNGQNGVTLIGPATTGNTIRGNRVFSNVQIGIDLDAENTFGGGDGVTANHIGGTPAGPNNLQNYPVITSTTPGSSTIINGTLNARPSLTYTLDFYAAPKPDVSYYGAAQTYLGSITVATDSSGNATFTATLNVATTAGQWVSATATSPTGDTSEFSEAEPLPWAGLGVNGSTWTPIGPAPIANQPVYAGRIEYATPDPSNPNVMYLAADGGGIWKTTDWLDPSPLWTPLTDNQPSLEAGSGNIGYQVLAVSKSSPNVVYAAVGGPGGGILKSINSGASWTELANSTFDLVDFGTLLVSPTDPNTLYVTVWFNGSTAAGLYKSTDGGVTWVNKTSSVHNGAVSDVVMDPTNPSTLYAGMVQGANGGTTNGIYKSTDAGATWNRMTTGTLSGAAVGVSIKLAISPSSPQTLYATVFDPALGNAPDGLPHRYVTTNGATSWTAMAALPSGDEPRYWHAVLAVDPTNPGTVYTNGDHSVYKSTDFGAHWTGSGFDDPVSVSFDDGGAYILTGDRGIYRSTTGMAPFDFKQGNLQTAELYTVTLDPTNPSVAYGISQDQIEAMKFQGGLAWAYLSSGDEVGKILVDAAHPNRIYSFDPNGGGAGSGTGTANFMQRSDDGGATWTSKITGLNTSLASFNYAYTSQKAFVIDPSNPNRLLLGETHVYETTNNADSWTDISPSGFPGNPFITAIGISPSVGSTIYVATADGHIYVTQNDGGTWTERDAGLPVDSFDSIGNLQVDPSNPNHVFAAPSVFPNDVFGSSHVWTTTNGGTSWTDIKGDLPSDDWATSLAVDWRPSTPILYLGTARGLFSSTNLGAHWATYKQGLPNAEVNDLQFLPQFNLLAAATYGRGVFEVITTAAATNVTVTSTAPTSTYGQAVTFSATVSATGSGPVPTGSVQFLVDGANFGSPVTLSAGQASSPSTSNLGAGTHIVQANYSGDGNYAANTGSFTQTVNKAHLAVVPDNLSKTVGQPNPTLTAHFTGFVLGETAATANVTGSPTLATTATTASPVGTYPITVTSANTLSAPNYDFPSASFGSGTLTVTQGAVSGVSVGTTLQNSTYGQSVSFTVLVTGSGPTPTGSVQFVVDGSNFGSPVALAAGQATSQAVANLGAGPHSVVADYLGDTNYAAANSSIFTQTVIKAHLAVVPDNLSKTVGQPNPTLTAHFTGFVLGETAATANVTGTPTLATTATTASPVGTYPITVTSANTLSAPNYDFPSASFGSGTLTVTQGAVSGVSVGTTLQNSTYGQSVSFTVLVTGSGPTPTGSVQFVVDGTNFGAAVALASGQATSQAVANLGAGPHSVVADYLGDTNYAAANSSIFTQTVIKAHLAVVPDNLSKSVGQPNPTLTAHLTGFVLGETAATANVTGTPTLATTATTASPVGTYPITVTSANTLSAPNYDFPSASFGSGTLTVTQGTVAGVVAGSTVPTSTYGQAFSYTATVNPPTGGPTPTGTVQFVVDGSNFGSPVTLAAGQASLAAPTNLGAGTHSVVADYLGDTNYATANSLVFTQTVNKAHLAVVPDNLTKSVGQPNPTLTAHFTGFVNGETAATANVTGTPTLSTTATTASPVGVYPITVTSANTLSAPNYDFPSASFGSGTLTVTQGTAPTVSVGSTLPTSTYGQSVSFTVLVTGSGPTPTGTVQFVVDGTNFGNPVALAAGQASSPSTSNLGAGTHTVQANYSGDGNYAAGSGSFTQTVNKAHLAVVPDNLSKSVGQPNPTLTAHLTGFVLGETAITANVTGTPTLATTATTASPVGTYPITVTNTGTLSAPNYDFPSASFGSGTLTVTQGVAPLIGVGSTVPTSTYGQSVSFTVAVSSSSGPTPTGNVQFVVDSVNFGGTVALVNGAATSGAIATLSAGNHAVEVDYLGDSNYAAALGMFTQVVNKAHLAVVPDNLSKTVGQPNPALTAHLTGFVLGETAGTAGVTGSPVLATTATTASPVGAYPITVTSAGTLAANNYDFPSASFGTGTLTVTQGTVLAVTVGSTLPISTYGQSVSFTVTVAPPSGGPTPTGNVQFVIDSVNFGSAVALVNGAATSGAIANLSAGNHSVAVNYLGDTNYASASGTFTQTVNKAHLAVVPDNLTKSVGQPNPTLTAHFTGFVLGETAATANVTGSPTLATTATTASPVGTYPITVTSANTLSAPNYDFPSASFGSGTLTVTQGAAPTVTVGSTLPISTYGQSVSFTVLVTGAGPTPTGTVQFLVDGSNFGSPVALAAGQATSQSVANLGAGTHTVLASYSGDGNYSAGSGSFTQTVNKAPLTLVVDNQSMNHFDVVPTPTFHLTGFVLGETPAIANVTVNATLTDTATSNSAAGYYPIHAVVNSSSAANYTVTAEQDGTMTVKPKVMGAFVHFGSLTMSLTTLNRDLPFINITAVDVLFSDPVVASQSMLSLTGVNNGTYAFSGFSNAAGNDPTWTLPTALGVDRLMMTLDGVAAPPLAGSGPNIVADHFGNAFAVLPGDVDGDGVVSAADAVRVRNLAAAGQYLVWADVNGDGTVDLATDFTEVRKRIGKVLP